MVICPAVRPTGRGGRDGADQAIRLDPRWAVANAARGNAYSVRSDLNTTIYLFRIAHLRMLPELLTTAPRVLPLYASQTILDALGRPSSPGQGEELEPLIHKEIGFHVGWYEVHPRHDAVSLARRGNGI
jgi:hypothetical protein